MTIEVATGTYLSCSVPAYYDKKAWFYAEKEGYRHHLVTFSMCFVLSKMVATWRSSYSCRCHIPGLSWLCPSTNGHKGATASFRHLGVLISRRSGPYWRGCEKAWSFITQLCCTSFNHARCGRAALKGADREERWTCWWSFFDMLNSKDSDVSVMRLNIYYN